METELDIAQAYLDRCLQAIVDGELTAIDTTWPRHHTESADDSVRLKLARSFEE